MAFANVDGLDLCCDGRALQGGTAKALPIMQTLVVLDIETTGLDPRRDAIIEIGAVRFRGSRVEDEWSELVNPGRPVPHFITQLTGITDEMVAGAPRISEVLPALEGFVGDHPILGHRVAFDLGFMRQQGLFGANVPLDTYDLAAVALPDAGRYGLAALASHLQVPLQNAHRALDDARTTMQVFLKLYAQILELPYSLLHAIAELGTQVDWTGGWMFEAALEEWVRKSGEPKSVEPLKFEALSQPPAEYERLSPREESQPLEPEELSAALEPGGALSKAFEGYEHRTQQVQMLEAVAQAFSDSQHLLVEAGTGIGKSMAYLIPSFAWAASNGQRVLISTNTINLQDQLINKDIPDLRRALGHDFSASVLKGRRNYLCPRRLSAMNRIGPRTPEEARILAKVYVWLHNGGTGDVTEINLRGPVEAAIWSRLSSDSEECSLEACLQHTGGTCPYYRSRREAETAHVVVVNHALLLADIGTGSRVIPEYEYLVVDEGHHLESATTRGLSFEVTEADLQRALRDLSGTGSGTLGRVLSLAQKALPPESYTEFRPIAGEIAEKARAAIEQTGSFFQRLIEFLERRRDGQPLGRYGQQERILPSTRSLPLWSEVEIGWDALRSPLVSVYEQLSRVAQGIEEIAESGPEQADDLSVGVRTLARDLGGIIASLDELIFEADPMRIYWLKLRGEPQRLSMHAAPLEVGPLVQKHLWHEKESIVLTSATLTTSGEFDYLKRRLSAEDAEELALGSPFDFESSTLMYLINDIPEPGDRRAYQAAFERGLIALCRATGGRALVLFTSNEQLITTARAISDPLGAEGVVVMEQSAGASRHALLESFRTTEAAVLLGTRSFWEGVDVPGEALSVLAIARLPFDVPNDPIVAARSETYDNPFGEYSLPEAILRFRQGFGRLIRTQSDRGVVVSFDRRLLSKSYGRAFIDSLPRTTQRIGPLSDLPGRLECPIQRAPASSFPSPRKL
jgi:DNA polymerase-3 subunit epsilon/ATP-dependent DNA helicase DinG